MIFTRVNFMSSKRFFLSLFLVIGLTFFIVFARGSARELKSSCENLGELFEGIKLRTGELDEREERLRLEEKKFEVLKAEVEERITELSKVRKRVEAVLKDIKSAENEGMINLVKIYESMSPEDAASRVEKLDQKLAVRLLKNMKSKKAGKILALVDSDQAARLSEELGNNLISLNFNLAP